MNWKEALDAAVKLALLIAALTYLSLQINVNVDWLALGRVLDPLSKFSVIVAAPAYLLQRRSMHLQHERARREKATAAIHEFTKTFTPRSAAARKLVGRLDSNQIEALDEGQEFLVDNKHKDLLLAALPDHVTPEQFSGSEAIKLTRNQSYLLRWEVISKLNSLEVLAQCWLTDVAHRETIESELTFLLEPKEGENVMTKCGRLAEPSRFPALAALMNELERIRRRADIPYKIDFMRGKRPR